MKKNESSSRFVPRPWRRTKSQQMDSRILSDLLATAENGQAVHIPVPAGSTVLIVQQRYRLALMRRGYTLHYRHIDGALVAWTARIDRNGPAAPGARYGE